MEYKAEILDALKSSARRALDDDEFDSDVLVEIAENIARVQKGLLGAKDDDERRMLKDASASLYAQFDTMIESELKDSYSVWADALKTVASTALDVAMAVAEAAGRGVGGAIAGTAVGFAEGIIRDGEEGEGSHDAVPGEET